MGIYKQRGTVNWIYRRMARGRRFVETTGTSDKQEAERIAAELDKKVELWRLAQPSGQPSILLKWNAAAIREVERIQGDVSIGQADRARYAFKNFAVWLGRDIPLDRIDAAMVEEYQRHRLKDASLSTVNKELNFVLRLLRNHGFQVQRPSAKRGRTVKHRIITPDQLIAFFKAIHRLDDWCLYMTQFQTGARLTELAPSKRTDRLGVLKSEIDLDAGTIIIRQAKRRSGQPPKEVKKRIRPELVAALRTYLTQVRGSRLWLPSNYRRRFEKYLEKAGIPKYDELGRKVTAHSFRHTYSTLEAEVLGGNVLALQASLGHESIQTTSHYSQMMAALGIEPPSVPVEPPVSARVMDMEA